jgi:RNA recognition motif-containing protein
MNMKHTLFLGDLSCFCQETDIFQAFEKFGDIQDIRLMRSRTDDSCLGYGFITFLEPKVANRALEAMNGQVVVGRKLK